MSELTPAAKITLVEFMRARLDEEEREGLRVADINARRTILRRYELLLQEPREVHSSPSVALPRVTLGEVVWHLATAYANHPDYRNEWSNPAHRGEPRPAPLPT